MLYYAVSLYRVSVMMMFSFSILDGLHDVNVKGRNTCPYYVPLLASK